MTIVLSKSTRSGASLSSARWRSRKLILSSTANPHSGCNRRKFFHNNKTRTAQAIRVFCLFNLAKGLCSDMIINHEDIGNYNCSVISLVAFGFGHISYDWRICQFIFCSCDCDNRYQTYRISLIILWAIQESNLWPHECESCALTSWANRPYLFYNIIFFNILFFDFYVFL